MSTVRFGVSMEEELVTLLDGLVQREGFTNRSEALRALVRHRVARDGHPQDDERIATRRVAGIVTLVYPYSRTLVRAPVAPFPSLTISANLQLHLEGPLCIKMMVVQGTDGEVREWARPVVSQKGVMGSLSLVATEEAHSALHH